VVAVVSGRSFIDWITYLAKGDVVLSVTLTAIHSVIHSFTHPDFLINLHSQTFSWRTGANRPADRLDMLQIVLNTLLPMRLAWPFGAASPAHVAREPWPVASGLLALIYWAAAVPRRQQIAGRFLSRWDRSASS